MNEVKRCRCCLTQRSNIRYFPNSAVGWEGLTYKEMFESSLGYEILSSEPQDFCVICIKKILQWYNFKNICKKTQETLHKKVALVKVRSAVLKEPEVGCDEITIEPEQIIKKEPEEELTFQKSEKTTSIVPTKLLSPHGIELTKEPFEVEFIVEKRFCVAKNDIKSVLIGNLSVVGQSLPEFMNQIWLFVEPHLKREVLFIDNKPYWHPDEHPKEQQLMRFITIYDLTEQKYFHDPSFHDYKSFVNKKPKILIHPYSKNVIAGSQYEEVFKLIKSESGHTSPPQSLDIATNQMIMKIDCYIILRAYRNCSRTTNESKYLGFVRFNCETLKEFMRQIWLFVKKHIVREVVFDEKGENPKWSSIEIPQELDLPQFIIFKDRNTGEYYKAHELSDTNLKSWTKALPTIFVFPYSINVSSLTQWESLKKIIHEKDYEDPFSEPSLKKKMKLS